MRSGWCELEALNRVGVAAAAPGEVPSCGMVLPRQPSPAGSRPSGIIAGGADGPRGPGGDSDLPVATGSQHAQPSLIHQLRVPIVLQLGLSRVREDVAQPIISREKSSLSVPFGFLQVPIRAIPSKRKVQEIPARSAICATLSITLAWSLVLPMPSNTGDSSIR